MVLACDGSSRPQLTIVKAIVRRRIMLRPFPEAGADPMTSRLAILMVLLAAPALSVEPVAPPSFGMTGRGGADAGGDPTFWLAVASFAMVAMLYFAHRLVTRR
jgi:hypothetical protein